MITAVYIYIDAVNSASPRARLVARDWLDHIPAWQVRAVFDDFSAACLNRCESALERRPVNGLNVEIGTPAPRCTLQPPEHWGDGASVTRWLGSGGSPLVLGACQVASCPRAQNAAACEAGRVRR